jgi:preprotein translocase subunit SecF
MFDFIGKRGYWFVFSGFLILLGIFSLCFNAFVHGKVMNFGIDFTGGTVISLRFTTPVTEDGVREVLAKHNLRESLIQRAGENDIFIRTEPVDPEVRKQMVDELATKYGNVELLESDTIGPVIGKELRKQAIWALIIASVGIVIYVSFRFEFKYAIAAIVALYHDAIIVTGLSALLWRNVETTFVAAILTIMGYSINDTIVIFDRIRENLKKVGGKKKNFKEI